MVRKKENEKKKAKEVARKILEDRPYYQHQDAVERGQQLTLYAFIGGVTLLGISTIKGCRIYLPYAIYTIVQFGVVWLCAWEYHRKKKPRFLCFAALFFILSYALERFHLGPLYEPMKNHLPTVVGSGMYRSPGLVKGIAVISPSLYLWTKVMYAAIWTILFFTAFRFRRVKR